MAEKYKLIRDESLRELMIAHYRQGYAIQLLSYICYKHNLDTALSIAEACGVLGISPRRRPPRKTRYAPSDGDPRKYTALSTWSRSPPACTVSGRWAC